MNGGGYQNSSGVHIFSSHTYLALFFNSPLSYLVVSKWEQTIPYIEEYQTKTLESV